MTMGYSISDLEKHTGVKAHTLRIWEKRYGICDPTRDDNNVRSYSEADLQKLLKISRLKKHGHRISNLAAMPELEMNRIYQDTFGQDSGRCVILDQLIEALHNAYESMLYEILQERLDKLGILEFARRIWEPLQERIAFLILSGSLQPVHLKLFDQVVERLLDAQNLKLFAEKDSCRGAVLMINSCGRSTSLFHQITKHLLIEKAVDVTSLNMCQSDWGSLENIFHHRTFSHLFIHYQRGGFEDAASFNKISDWVPDRTRIIIYGSMDDAEGIPPNWKRLRLDEVAHFIDEEWDYTNELEKAS